MSLVITIGRQYGSAGIEIGKKTAELLGVPFYDKELVEMAAEKSNLNTEALKEVDERATNSFLYSLVSGSYSMRRIGSPIYYDMPINDKLFIAQTEVIKGLAAQDCVITGRCADYVLEHEEKVKTLSVFLYAPLDFRIDHVMSEDESLTRPKAKEKIMKADKRRKNYYEYYNGKDWGTMKSYKLCIDVDKVGIEIAAQMIVDCAKKLAR